MPNRILWLAVFLPFLVACDGETGTSSSDSLLPYGLTSSMKNQQLVEDAIDISNKVLEVASNYRLCPSRCASSTGGIPVHLVQGSALGKTEYVFVFEKLDDDVILVNDHAVSRMMKTLSVAYDPTGFHHPFSEATIALVVILLHEVGHIAIEDGYELSHEYPPLMTQVLQLTDKEKFVELKADWFASEQLRSLQKRVAEERDRGWGKLVQEQHPELFTEIGSVVQGGMQQYAILLRNYAERKILADILQRTVLQIVLRLAPSGSLIDERARVTNSYSHLDLDLRFLFLAELRRKEETFFEENTFFTTDAIHQRMNKDLFAEAERAVQNRKVELSLRDREEVLSYLLQHSDIRVREGAHREIKKLLMDGVGISDNTLNALLDALSQKHGEVPHLAYTVTFLGAKAVPALTKALQHQNPTARLEAIYGLLFIEPGAFVDRPETILAITAAVDDSNSEIGEVAEQILEKLQ